MYVRSYFSKCFYIVVTIESEDDIREFVKAKIESLVANVAADQDVVAETETNRFKSATTRFHRIFNIPVEEKLVNCKLLYFWQISKLCSYNNNNYCRVSKCSSARNLGCPALKSFIPLRPLSSPEISNPFCGWSIDIFWNHTMSLQKDASILLCLLSKCAILHSSL